MLDKPAIVIGKRRWNVAIDIELSDHGVSDEDGSDNLGLSFDRTGEIAGIGIHIVYDDGLRRRNSRSADSLVQRDSFMRRFRPDVGAEKEHGLRGGIVLIEQVEAHPVVVRHELREALHEHGHQLLGAVSGVREIRQLVRQSLIVRRHEGHMITRRFGNV